MNIRHDNTRQHILETGQRIIVGKGFASVGLNEILSAAGVPKGSFYHYFASKEQYGEALIQEYFDRYLSDLDALFAADIGSGKERLLAFWQRWLDNQLDACSDQKCLVVKLAAEVSDLSDAMRITLRDGTDQIICRIARIVDAGVTDGSIPPQDSQATAQTLYQLWLGASLISKLHRNAKALENAMSLTRQLLT